MEDYNHFNNARVATELQNEGVDVLLGAHGQREGLAAHWEMWMFAQGGMSPWNVIKASTIDGAKYIGMDDQLGSIKAGKLADLVILQFLFSGIHLPEFVTIALLYDTLQHRQKLSCQ